MNAFKAKTRSALPLLSATLLLAILAGIFAYAYFGLGLRTYVVETPSMGTYAPVGTLVISRPVTAEIKVGDTILFTPASTPRTYFHRVITVSPTGISTAGDLTREQDPWLLTKKDIVGVEALHMANLGWVLKASPILIIAALLIWLYVRFFVDRFWKFPAIFFGASTAFSLANYVFHPFVQASLLDKSVQNNVAVIRFVNTGILPLDVREGNSFQLVKQGELFVANSNLTRGDSYSVSALPHAEWWMTVLFAATIALPTIVAFAYLIRVRLTKSDWYYVPLSDQEIPEQQVIDNAGQLLLDGKIYRRYNIGAHEPQEYWLEGAEALSEQQLAERVLLAR